jgi:bifunctional non-homologous end joining protein LigD
MHVTKAPQIRRLVTEVPVHYVVFDLLHLDGRSLLGEPYDERRRALESLGLAGACWTTAPTFDGSGDDVLAAAEAQGLEGIVSKRRDSRYYAGRRSDCWVKVKAVATQDVVVCGWEPGEGRRKGAIGALLVGVYGDDGLTYAGQVGTGFSDATLRDLGDRLAPLARRDPPYDGPVPREYAKSARWVEPVLVAEVAYGNWTRDGRLRHPSYLRLRPDKSPSEAVRES